jgi:hypothetical protein
MRGLFKIQYFNLLLRNWKVHRNTSRTFNIGHYYNQHRTLLHLTSDTTTINIGHYYNQHRTLLQSTSDTTTINIGHYYKIAYSSHAYKNSPI